MYFLLFCVTFFRREMHPVPLAPCRAVWAFAETERENVLLHWETHSSMGETGGQPLRSPSWQPVPPNLRFPPFGLFLSKVHSLWDSCLSLILSNDRPSFLKAGLVTYLESCSSHFLPENTLLVFEPPSHSHFACSKDASWERINIMKAYELRVLRAEQETWFNIKCLLTCEPFLSRDPRRIRVPKEEIIQMYTSIDTTVSEYLK